MQSNITSLGLIIFSQTKNTFYDSYNTDKKGYFENVFICSKI